MLAILELALIHQCLFEPTQLASSWFSAPSSISFLRRFAPTRLSSIKRKINHNLVETSNKNDLFKNLTQTTNQLERKSTGNIYTETLKNANNPIYEFYLPAASQLPQNDFIHNLLPVLQSPTIDLLNHLNSHLNHHHHSFNNDLNRLDQLDQLDRLDQLDNRFEQRRSNNHQNEFNNNHLLHQNPSTHHQSILIHHRPTTIQRQYSFYHLKPHPHLIHHQISSSNYHSFYHPHHSHQILNRLSTNRRYQQSIANQSPYTTLLSKVQQLKFKPSKNKFKNHLHQSKNDFFYLSRLKNLNDQLTASNKKTDAHHHLPVQLTKLEKLNKLDKLTITSTINPLNEPTISTTIHSTSSSGTGYLQIGSTAHLNQFSFDTEGEDYPDNNLDDEINKANQLNSSFYKIDSPSLLSSSSSLSTINSTGNELITNLLTPSSTSLLKNDLENFLKQIKPNFVNFNNHQTSQDDLQSSKYAYDLIGSNSTVTNLNNQNFHQNIQVDFKERTAPDSTLLFFLF